MNDCGCIQITLFSKIDRGPDLVGLQVEMPTRICGSGIQMRDEVEFVGENEVFNVSHVSLFEMLGRRFLSSVGLPG